MYLITNNKYILLVFSVRNEYYIFAVAYYKCEVKPVYNRFELLGRGFLRGGGGLGPAGPIPQKIH
jgi:hypothetical protein